MDCWESEAVDWLAEYTFEGTADSTWKHATEVIAHNLKRFSAIAASVDKIKIL